MNALLLSFLGLFIVSSASAQILPPGAYAQYFYRAGHAIQIQVDTNYVVRIAWLQRINPITGGVRRAIYGAATNKPNGIIRGTLPGHGYLRGRVSLGETNGVRGTLFLWAKDDRHPVARHFQAKDIWAGFPPTTNSP